MPYNSQKGKANNRKSNVVRKINFLPTSLLPRGRRKSEEFKNKKKSWQEALS